MVLLFGGALAHSQVDGSLFRGNRDLLYVLPPLSLEEQLILLLLLHVLLLLMKEYTAFKTCSTLFSK